MQAKYREKKRLLEEEEKRAAQAEALKELQREMQKAEKSRSKSKKRQGISPTIARMPTPDVADHMTTWDARDNDPLLAPTRPRRSTDECWMILMAGSDPMLAGVPVEIKKSAVKQGKPNKSIFAAAKSWFFQKRNEDELLQAQKNVHRAIRSELYHRYPTQLDLRDGKRFIEKIVMSPNARYAAMADSLGRIWVWDSLLSTFIRILKGYRRAQIGWMFINQDLTEVTPSPFPANDILEENNPRKKKSTREFSQSAHALSKNTVLPPSVVKHALHDDEPPFGETSLARASPQMSLGATGSSDRIVPYLPIDKLSEATNEEAENSEEDDENTMRSLPGISVSRSSSRTAISKDRSDSALSPIMGGIRFDSSVESPLSPISFFGDRRDLSSNSQPTMNRIDRRRSDGAALKNSPNSSSSRDLTNPVKSWDAATRPPLFGMKVRETMRRNALRDESLLKIVPHSFAYLPPYLHRRHSLVFVLYLPSRGLLEMHYMGAKKRVYGVNIFTNGTMIYHQFRLCCRLFSFVCAYKSSLLRYIAIVRWTRHGLICYFGKKMEESTDLWLMLHYLRTM